MCYQIVRLICKVTVDEQEDASHNCSGFAGFSEI